MCTNIGHSHPRVIKAIQEQAAKLCYANPFMATEPRARLGEEARGDHPGRHRHLLLHQRRRRGQRERHPHRAGGDGPAQDHGPLPLVPRRHGGRHRAHRRPPALGLRAGHPRASSASPTSTSGAARTPSRWRTASATSRKSSATRAGRTSRPSSWRRVVGTNGILIPPDGYMQGLRRDLRPPRHPAHRRRGHVGLRAHGQVVRRRPLGRGARPHHHGQGPDLRLRAARGRGHAPARSRAPSRRRPSPAASPTTATPWPAPPRSPPSRSTRTRRSSRTQRGWARSCASGWTS